MSALFDSQSIRDLVKMSLGTHKGSWWADPDFGSKLHSIQKVNGNTAVVFANYCKEALQWLLDDGLVEDVVVQAERSGRNGISYKLTLTKPDGENELLEAIWQV